MYIVMNIGCIECGVSSKIVGVFTDKDRAHAVAEACQELHHWREGGQNHYQVFKLPKRNQVDTEYTGVE